MGITAVQSQFQGQVQSKLNIVTNFFQRNKPIESLVFQMLNAVYFVITLRTRMKLNKYRYLLAVEKLEKMQDSLASSYQPNNSCGRINKLQ